MALETVTHISDLVVTNPTSTDPKSEGDNHLRNIKIALKTDLPNITGPITKTHTQLNNSLDKTANETITGALSVANSLLVTAVAGLGYGTGAGGTVTQATSKNTSVTLNKPCGQITMSNSALAANTTTSFILNNSTIAATDAVIVSVNWNASVIYNVWVYTTSAGACSIAVRNISGGSASDAIVINFAVIKGATS